MRARPQGGRCNLTSERTTSCCRRLTYRRVGTARPWRPIRPARASGARNRHGRRSTKSGSARPRLIGTAAACRAARLARSIASVEEAPAAISAKPRQAGVLKHLISVAVHHDRDLGHLTRLSRRQADQLRRNGSSNDAEDCAGSLKQSSSTGRAEASRKRLRRDHASAPWRRAVVLTVRPWSMAGEGRALPLFRQGGRRSLLSYSSRFPEWASHSRPRLLWV